MPGEIPSPPTPQQRKPKPDPAMESSLPLAAEATREWHGNGTAMTVPRHAGQSWRAGRALTLLAGLGCVEERQRPLAARGRLRLRALLAR